MRKLVFLFLILLSPFGLAASVFVDFPEACVSQKKFPCTVKSLKIPLQFNAEAVQYNLAPETSLKLESGTRFQILQGQAWVQSEAPVEIKINANLNMGFQGEIFCHKGKDMNTHIRNLNASEIRFDSAHIFKQEALPTGFENWYGALATDGQILRGIIRPISKESFLADWMPLAGSNAAELRKKAKQYLDLWSEAVNESANLYQEIAERRLASVREKQNAQAQKAQKRNEQELELRRHYREKNGL